MIDSSIARDIWPITPHATYPVGGNGSTRRAFGVRVEGAGNLVCRTEGGIADVTIAMAAGETLPVVPAFRCGNRSFFHALRGGA